MGAPSHAEGLERPDLEVRRDERVVDLDQGETVNGIIELHRRLARCYRNSHNYSLRMLLAASGLTP
ncbi:MAG: hypothetical protein EOL89_14755 [Actinobacteria bacterium]|nr:hypothetical protein [Actinomycetota bacterium]